MKCTVLILLVFTAVCCAEVSLDELPKLPDGIDVDEVLEKVKSRCDSKGGAGTFDNIKKVRAEVQQCITGLGDINTIKNEVEEAKKTGSMDEVFGKYCRKRPELKACVDKLINAVKPCLEDNEKQALNVTLNIVQELGEFVCYRDGDRIAMFVAEGGVECLKDHTENVKNCINATFNLNPASISPNSIPDLSIDKKKCDDLSKVQTCVVTELEKCTDSTPANIVDALFRFIKKSACKKKNRRNVNGSELRMTFSSMKNGMGLKYLDLVKNMCENNSKSIDFDEIRESFEQANSCWKNVTIFVTPLDDINNALDACFKDFLQVTRNCLPDHAKFYPEFGIELSKSFMGFAYKFIGKLRSMAFDVEIINCFQSIRYGNLTENIQRCGDLSISEIPSKEQLCGFLTSKVQCVKSLVEEVCIKDIKIKQITDEITDVVYKPCSKNYDEN